MQQLTHSQPAQWLLQVKVKVLTISESLLNWQHPLAAHPKVTVNSAATVKGLTLHSDPAACCAGEKWQPLQHSVSMFLFL